MKYPRDSHSKDRITVSFICILSVFFLFPSVAFPGVFRVTPIKFVFDKEVKSGIVNVINEGEEPLQVQMKAFEWTQDPEGKDQYTETEDIIFFPRMMTINKNEERILRAGIKATDVAQEKTYRLFIEEIPGPRKAQPGAQVQVAIRLGVPIFVKPLKEEIQGKIEKVALAAGQLQIVIRNTGNSHFFMESVVIKGSDLKGTESYSKELSGWYVLAGATRSYETPISEEACRDTAKLDVEVKTSEFTLHEKLDVVKTLCLP